MATKKQIKQIKHMKKNKILILYAEVMGYLLVGINKYLDIYKDAEILLFELDEQKKTKFSFEPTNFSSLKKSNFKDYTSFSNRCKEFDPDLVLVSGRMHPHYLNVARYFKNRNIYTVTLQDTQYESSFRQNIIRLLSGFLYKRNFNGFWGAGSPQIAFAYSLGFKKQDIFEGILVADLDIFLKKNRVKKENQTPYKTILYVGRFSVEKNIPLLIKVFLNLNRDHKNIHKLILVGEGPLKIESSQNIEVYPFMTASELSELVQNKHIDAFCLPSLYEPWGLVIHEFAASELPLIISNRCGASTKFFIEGYNGFSFDPTKYESLLLALNNFIKMKKNEIKLMGNNSYTLAHQITPSIWAATLQSIFIRSQNHRSAVNSL